MACLEGLGAGSRSSRKSISTVGENPSCLVVPGGGATSGGTTAAWTLKNERDCQSLMDLQAPLSSGCGSRGQRQAQSS